MTFITNLSGVLFPVSKFNCFLKTLKPESPLGIGKIWYLQNFTPFIYWFIYLFRSGVRHKIKFQSLETLQASFSTLNKPFHLYMWIFQHTINKMRKILFQLLFFLYRFSYWPSAGISTFISNKPSKQRKLFYLVFQLCCFFILTSTSFIAINKIRSYLIVNLDLLCMRSPLCCSCRLKKKKKKSM